MNRARLVTALLLGAFASTAANAALEVDERWYAAQVNGMPAGYQHEVITRTAGGGSETHTEGHLELNRLDTVIDIAEDDLAREDAAGLLTALTVTTRQSTERTTVEIEVRPDGIEVTSTAGRGRYQQRLPAVADLLGPVGIRMRTRDWLANPSAPLAYRTFEPEASRVVRVTRRLVDHDSAGNAIVEERIDDEPGHSRLVLDPETRTLEDTQITAYSELHLRLSDAVSALATLGSGPRAELLAKTLLRTNVRLPDARRLERLRVTLDLIDADGGWPNLESPGQHVVAASPTRRVLELTRLRPATDLPAAPAPADPDLAPNVLLQADDPDVVALAATLRRPGAGALAQALVLRDWVATRLTFDLGLSVAPAGTVVRDRRGTCVAYAVLTASLARALGIPARVVLGYVYIDGVFAGHAWTEVRVGSEWIPVDAAVWGPGTADPARIALARHGGEAGIGSGAMELAQLLGRVAIRINGYTLGAHATTVPQNAAPYQIVGRRYRNPWLGVELDAPPDYRFVGVDAVYPAPALLQLLGPGGARITLSPTPIGPVDATAESHLAELRQATEPATDDGTRCASGAGGRYCVRRVGDTLWTLAASPGDATARLPAVLRSLRIEH